ncbi:MAG: hypothetical protein V3W44_08535 [Dehalococcoidales bacterium]
MVDIAEGGGGDAGAGDAGAGGDAGGGGDHWTTSLPEDMRESGSLKRYDTAEAAHRGHLDLEKKMGGNADTLLHIPEESDTEGWNALFTKLGRPDSHEKYGFPDLGPNADPDDLDEVMRGQLAQGFHAANLTTKQAEQIYNTMITAQDDQLKRAKAEVAGKNEASTAALKAEWGVKYEDNLGLAKRAFAVFPESLQVIIADSGFTQDIDYIKGFHKFGQFLGEDGSAGGSGAGGFGGMNKEQASVKLTEFTSDAEKTKALNDLRSPGHAAAKAEWVAINLALVGGEAKPLPNQ